MFANSIVKSLFLNSYQLDGESLLIGILIVEHYLLVEVAPRGRSSTSPRDSSSQEVIQCRLSVSPWRYRIGIPLNWKELPRDIDIGDRNRTRYRMELLISAGNDLARNNAGLWPAARFSTSNAYFSNVQHSTNEV